MKRLIFSVLILACISFTAFGNTDKDKAQNLEPGIEVFDNADISATIDGFSVEIQKLNHNAVKMQIASHKILGVTEKPNCKFALELNSKTITEANYRKPTDGFNFRFARDGLRKCNN